MKLGRPIVGMKMQVKSKDRCAIAATTTVTNPNCRGWCNIGRARLNDCTL